MTAVPTAVPLSPWKGAGKTLEGRPAAVRFNWFV